MVGNPVHQMRGGADMRWDATTRPLSFIQMPFASSSLALIATPQHFRQKGQKGLDQGLCTKSRKCDQSDQKSLSLLESGRRLGEGHSICRDLDPHPRASRASLPSGRGAFRHNLDFLFTAGYTSADHRQKSKE
jgi:hypothetical protein